MKKRKNGGVDPLLAIAGTIIAAILTAILIIKGLAAALVDILFR